MSLHVYTVSHLASVQKANNVLGKMGGGGAYHAAVEVYGKEWSFGGTFDDSTGVFCCQPGGCDDHAYLKAIPMGSTRMTHPEVLGLIGRLAKEWQGEDYDLLRCNCCHFSDELLRRLGVGAAPRWLNSLAGRGAAVDDQVQAAATMVAKGQVAAKSVGNDSIAMFGLQGPRCEEAAATASVTGANVRSTTFCAFTRAAECAKSAAAVAHRGQGFAGFASRCAAGPVAGRAPSYGRCN